MINRQNYAGETMRLIATFLVLLGTLVLAACTPSPGWDSGRYATHDRGNGTVDKTAKEYFSQPRYGY